MNRVELRCGRWLAGLRLPLFAAAALIFSLALGQAAAAPIPAPQPEKVEPERKDDPKPGQLPGGFEDLKKMIEQVPNLPPEQRDRILRQLDEMARRLEQMQQQFPNLPIQPGNRFPGLRRIPLGNSAAEGRFGARLSPITETLQQQLDLPKGNGQVIGKVEKDSAAEKAGLQEHDILLELGGKKVPADAAEFNKMLEEIKPGTPVDAIVLRKGKKTEVKGVNLPEAPAQPAVPRFQIRPGNIQILPIPIQPGQPMPFPFPPGGGGGFIPLNPGNVVSISITKNGNETVVAQTEGTLKARVVVVEENGKHEVKEITVDDNGKETRYESLEKVPEEHKERVKKLIEMASNQGGLRFEFRLFPNFPPID
jgi:membrane-associated protease RseP (regulator of RpoE activity)